MKTLLFILLTVFANRIFASEIGYKTAALVFNKRYLICKVQRQQNSCEKYWLAPQPTKDLMQVFQIIRMNM